MTVMRCPICKADLDDAEDYVVIQAQREHHDGSITVLASKELLKYCPEHSPHQLYACGGGKRYWKEPTSNAPQTARQCDAEDGSTIVYLPPDVP